VYAEEVLNHQGNEVTYGRTAATNAYTARPLAFTTNDRHKSSVSFAVLNDIHERTADIPVLLNNADYSKRDMIIYNGDMVSSFDSEDQIFKYFMDESVKLFAGRQPLYYARGNHETRGVFATSFQKYFCPQEPHLYFTVRQGPACFVFLDTGEDKPDNDIEYSGITDYDNYRTEQAHWLAGVLQSKDYTEAKFKIIVCHMPPVDEEPIWHGQAEVLNKFVPLLNKAHVTVMLCGHLHFYLYKAPSKEINFPIIVNSLDTVLSGTAEGKTLDIEIKNKAGNTIEKKSYTVD
jgi:predicted phosphodiesterase